MMYGKQYKTVEEYADAMQYTPDVTITECRDFITTGHLEHKDWPGNLELINGQTVELHDWIVKIRVSETIGGNNFIVKKMGDSNFMNKYVLA